MPSLPGYIIGGGGTALPVTAADELLDGASPSRFFTTADDGRGELITPASARTLIRGSAAIPGASFTATAGLGTATASTLTMTTAVQTSGSWADNPRLMYNHGGDPWNVSVTATLAALTGGDANTFMPFALRNSAGDTLLMVQARASDGLVSVYGNSGGDLMSNAVTMPFDGTGAFRIVLREGRATVYQSTNSGANWRIIYRGDSNLPTSSPWTFTYVSFNLYQGAAPGGTVTAQWSGVTLATAL